MKAPRPINVTDSGIVTDKKSNVATAGLDLSEKSLDTSPFYVTFHRVGGSYPGTGDLFASVLLGKMLGGAPFAKAVTVASAFVRDVISVSEKYDTATEFRLSHVFINYHSYNKKPVRFARAFYHNRNCRLSDDGKLQVIDWKNSLKTACGRARRERTVLFPLENVCIFK